MRNFCDKTVAKAPRSVTLYGFILVEAVLAIVEFERSEEREDFEKSGWSFSGDVWSLWRGGSG
jgi:hypothetical protein